MGVYFLVWSYLYSALEAGQHAFPSSLITTPSVSYEPLPCSCSINTHTQLQSVSAPFFSQSSVSSLVSLCPSVPPPHTNVTQMVVNHGHSSPFTLVTWRVTSGYTSMRDKTPKSLQRRIYCKRSQLSTWSWLSQSPWSIDFGSNHTLTTPTWHVWLHTWIHLPRMHIPRRTLRRGRGLLGKLLGSILVWHSPVVIRERRSSAQTSHWAIFLWRSWHISVHTLKKPVSMVL